MARSAHWIFAIAATAVIVGVAVTDPARAAREKLTKATTPATVPTTGPPPPRPVVRSERAAPHRRMTSRRRRQRKRRRRRGHHRRGPSVHSRTSVAAPRPARCPPLLGTLAGAPGHPCHASVARRPHQRRRRSATARPCSAACYGTLPAVRSPSSASTSTRTLCSRSSRAGMHSTDGRSQPSAHQATARHSTSRSTS